MLSATQRSWSPQQPCRVPGMGSDGTGWWSGSQGHQLATVAVRYARDMRPRILSIRAGGKGVWILTFTGRRKSLSDSENTLIPEGKQERKTCQGGLGWGSSQNHVSEQGLTQACVNLGWGMLNLGRGSRGLKAGLGKQLSPVVLRPLGFFRGKSL